MEKARSASSRVASGQLDATSSLHSHHPQQQTVSLSIFHVAYLAAALVVAVCGGAALVAMSVSSKAVAQRPRLVGQWRIDVVEDSMHLLHLLQSHDAQPGRSAQLRDEELAHVRPLLKLLDEEMHRHLGPQDAAAAPQQQQQQQQSAGAQKAVLPIVAKLAKEAGLKEHAQPLVSAPQLAPSGSTNSTAGGKNATAAAADSSKAPAFPEVPLPDNFRGVREASTLPLWPEVLPQSLDAAFPGGQPPADKDALQFHWVITSCDRYQWGRLMSTTLLSGLFNGLKPTSVSVVWCKPYQEGAYPSLLRNLRHSHSINIFFPNADLFHNETHPSLTSPEATYLTALMVPKCLGLPLLPLLVTEDDILVAPDANERLANAVERIRGTVGGDPYMIQAYSARGVGPAPTTAEGIEQRPDDLGNAAPSHDTSRTNMQFYISYGAQAYLFSPGMTALLLHDMLSFLAPGSQRPNHLQDMHVFTLVKDKYRCNNDGSHCWYYTMYPSLVQHLGTSSSLFNLDEKGQDHKLNQRWHVAHDFPVKVSFPGYDPEGMWRRRQAKRRRAGSRRLLGGGGHAVLRL